MIFIRQLVNLYSGVFVSRLNSIESWWLDNFRSGNIHEVFVSSKLQNMNNALKDDLVENLWIKWLEWINIHRNYLVEWLTDSDFEKTVSSIFSEAPVDNYCNEEEFIKNSWNKQMLVIESAAWQFDTRVDAVDKNILLVTWNENAKSRYKDIITFDWNISDEDMKKIEKYLINPNEKIKSDIDEKNFDRKLTDPINHVIMEWFTDIETDEWFKEFLGKNWDIAIEIEDIFMVKEYFKNIEKRDPTKVELLLIWTYWSDHCRHTTFETQIEWLEVTWVESFVEDFKKFRSEYLDKNLEKWKEGDTFMQLATSSLRFLKDDPQFKWAKVLDISEEDNAASFKIKIELENWKSEDWILMFKNETHNSPTNSEPFWWAATCLGGAIRDTLSGRSFTFVASRITGSWDPTEPISETMAWLVSQRALSIWAALWYSSYWNQIGLAATQVREYFHPGYKAKRFEMWIVIAAVKEENLKRKTPVKWDIIIQYWWPTWRDGIWWATVSSKVSWSLDDKKMWAHVQKWNPVEERKFQRLHLNNEYTRLIKKSNDFWAWGFSVAWWELSRGLELYLDEAGKHVKYQGLSDEELMISESQEKMTIIVASEDKLETLRMLKEENIVAFVVWKVTDNAEDSSKDRLTVKYQWKNIVDLSRDFLDENWAERKHDAKVELWKVDFFDTLDEEVEKLVYQWDFMWAFKKQLWLLVNASQRWLQWWFDSSVWASTVLAPYWWKYQTSPQIASASKIPTFDWVDSKTWVINAHWFNPYLLSQNTYIWWMYSILETISKVVATGWEHEQTWISLQEYFGKLTSDEKYWEVYAWLLWTLKVLVELKIAAIGWKDSMSGTHKTKEGEVLDVPPTIVWVAVAPVDTEYVVSSEFKKSWSSVLCFRIERNDDWLPDIQDYLSKIGEIEWLIKQKLVLSSSVVWQGWIIQAISNLSLWNKIWFKFSNTSKENFLPNLWDIIIEVSEETAGLYKSKLLVWKTTASQNIKLWDDKIEIDEVQSIMDKKLDKIWDTDKWGIKVEDIPLFTQKYNHELLNVMDKKPVALIPVFPWTNSELDTKHALLKAWFDVVEHVFNDVWTPEEQAKSRIEFAEKIKSTNMLVIPWWFSWWDEPWASWIWAVNVLKSKEIRSTLQEFFDKKDTLSFWICNWAQILNKLWVIDNWEITDHLEDSDTIITHNERLNHETWLVRTKVTSILSPFFNQENLWEEFLLNISHWEWNFQISDEKLAKYIEKWQVPLQYIDEEWNPTNKYNGSTRWVAWLTSPDWTIWIIMPHNERTWLNVAKNIPWEKLLPIFKNAFWFFKWEIHNSPSSGTTAYTALWGAIRDWK